MILQSFWLERFEWEGLNIRYDARARAHLRKNPRNVTEIADVLNQEQSMISHNLRPLERCRFVFSERRKKERFYSLNKETMEPLFKIFAHHARKYCPAGGKCLTAKHLKERNKKEAINPLYLSCH